MGNHRSGSTTTRISVSISVANPRFHHHQNDRPNQRTYPMQIGVSSYSFSRLVQRGRDAADRGHRQGQGDRLRRHRVLRPFACPRAKRCRTSPRNCATKRERVGIEIVNYTIGADFLNGSGGDLRCRDRAGQGRGRRRRDPGRARHAPRRHPAVGRPTTSAPRALTPPCPAGRRLPCRHRVCRGRRASGPWSRTTASSARTATASSSWSTPSTTRTSAC